MTKLSQDTWVLIADGQKALFLQNHTDGDDPYLQVVRKEEQENPPTREQAANRPGRMSDGPSGHRSAFDDTDWHELEKERFAKDLSDILYKLAHKGSYDRIVLVAPPAVLGELRDNLHKEVQNKVVGEIPKTLTNHPIEEIEKIVAGELAQA